MINQTKPKEALQLPKGYTIDEDGRLNNFAIEPEIYIRVPGDLRQKQAEEKAQRRHEMEELLEEEDGKLIMDHDFRHKGPGLI